MTNNGLAAMLFRVEKFIYSEKATKFCKISTLLLTTVHTVKRKVEILQKFVAFSDYMNFMWGQKLHLRHIIINQNRRLNLIKYSIVYV